MTHNELDHSFPTPKDCAKFHQVLFKIPTTGAMTYRQTDYSNLVICLMLCYGNGTDNKSYIGMSTEGSLC